MWIFNPGLIREINVSARTGGRDLLTCRDEARNKPGAACESFVDARIFFLDMPDFHRERGIQIARGKSSPVVACIRTAFMNDAYLHP